MDCDLCASQIVSGTLDNRWDIPLGEEEKYLSEYDIKTALFHDPCYVCDNINTTANLCDKCQHLRVRHLVLCFPEIMAIKSNDRKISIRLHHFVNFLESCDFCRFIASFVTISEVENTSKYGVDLQIHKDKTYFLGGYMPDGMGLWDSLAPRLFNVHDPVRSPYIDWTWLQEQLQRISSLPERRRKEWGMVAELQKELVDLRVIDVLKNCVVPRPSGSKHVALSYVWGSSEGHLQALRSNVSFLERTGSLSEVDLPQTIRDAMLATKKLDQQFLWVDRLCIIQDESAETKSVQLKQMGSAFHQALVTLVAMEGDDSTYGLPGISRARDPFEYQKLFRFDEEFGLSNALPSLESHLRRCKWTTRGWTYQEQIASSLLLYFSNAGCYIESAWKEVPPKTRQEGHPIISEYLADYEQPELVQGLEILRDYSRKNFTKSTDILHALSGLLTAMYGDRTYFGMLLDDFDDNLLWFPANDEFSLRQCSDTDYFPSWSWTSAVGGINFWSKSVPTFSIAYWARPVIRIGSASNSLNWIPIILNADNFTKRPLGEMYSQVDFQVTTAAISWMYGCIVEDVTKEIKIGMDEYNGIGNSGCMVCGQIHQT